MLSQIKAIEEIVTTGGIYEEDEEESTVKLMSSYVDEVLQDMQQASRHRLSDAVKAIVPRDSKMVELNEE